MRLNILVFIWPQLHKNTLIRLNINQNQIQITSKSLSKSVAFSTLSVKPNT